MFFPGHGGRQAILPLTMAGVKSFSLSVAGLRFFVLEHGGREVFGLFPLVWHECFL